MFLGYKVSQLFCTDNLCYLFIIIIIIIIIIIDNNNRQTKQAQITGE